ncbi:MAG: alpha/beta hydrolase [Solirubrobacterales bacterium]
MPTVEAGGATVAFTVAGEGPGLVLVHGTGGDAATTWSTVGPALAESWTLVMPDLPGSGATADPGDPLDLAALAEQVDAAAGAAGLRSYSVVGFSLGAAVAATLAAAEPERVESLIMLAGPIEGSSARVHVQFDLWRDLHALDPDLFARLWMLTGFSSGFVAELPLQGLDTLATFPVAPGLARQCELNKSVELEPVLGAIRSPALFLGASEDWIAPPALVREAAERVPGATYEELECGHFAVLERPDEVVARIEAFLRR